VGKNEVYVSDVGEFSDDFLTDLAQTERMLGSDKQWFVSEIKCLSAGCTVGSSG
jgi:hypothetical protein